MKLFALFNEHVEGPFTENELKARFQNHSEIFVWGPGLDLWITLEEYSKTQPLNSYTNPKTNLYSDSQSIQADALVYGVSDTMKDSSTRGVNDATAILNLNASNYTDNENRSANNITNSLAIDKSPSVQVNFSENNEKEELVSAHKIEATEITNNTEVANNSKVFDSNEDKIDDNTVLTAIRAEVENDAIKDNLEWFYAFQKETYGPMNEQALHEVINKQFKDKSKILVWHKGLPGWELYTNEFKNLNQEAA